MKICVFYPWGSHCIKLFPPWKHWGPPEPHPCSTKWISSSSHWLLDLPRVKWRVTFAFKSPVACHLIFLAQHINIVIQFGKWNSCMRVHQTCCSDCSFLSLIKYSIVSRKLLACGEYGGDIGQISRHTGSNSSFSLPLHCPLTTKQSPLSLLLIFVLLIRASCLPCGGTLDISSGRGEEIIFRGQACASPSTKSICLLLWKAWTWRQLEILGSFSFQLLLYFEENIELFPRWHFIITASGAKSTMVAKLEKEWVPM